MVHVYLAVTCHLHFWQNDWDLLCVTAVHGGGMDTKIRVSIVSWPWKRKLSCCSCWDSNLQPFDCEASTLPELSPLLLFPLLYMISDSSIAWGLKCQYILCIKYKGKTCFKSLWVCIASGRYDTFGGSHALDNALADVADGHHVEVVSAGRAHRVGTEGDLKCHNTRCFCCCWYCCCCCCCCRGAPQLNTLGIIWCIQLFTDKSILHGGRTLCCCVSFYDSTSWAATRNVWRICPHF